MKTKIIDAIFCVKRVIINFVVNGKLKKKKKRNLSDSDFMLSSLLLGVKLGIERIVDQKKKTKAPNDWVWQHS